MSNTIKQIDLLDRNSLIQICKKLEIPGYSSNFNNPYKNKETLKMVIINYIKTQKKLKRSNSLSSVNQTNKPKLLNKSKSLSQINSKDNLSIQTNISNMGNLTQNMKSCVFPKVKKLVAIGDIHGDLSVAIKSLKLAGVIDLSLDDNIKNINNIKWTGQEHF